MVKERKSTYDPQAGFTLIELAVVVMVVGLFMAGAFGFASIINKASSVKATEGRMEHIVDALAVYAQRNNRIPCPADPDRGGAAEPYGAEVGSGPNGDQVPGGCSRAEGIVPFRTLGLGSHVMEDGWDSAITYRVSPAFARDPAGVAAAHARCRIDGRWVSSGDNRNPYKAAFCCSDGALAGNDIVILDENNRPLWPFGRTSASYAPVDVAHIGSASFNIATDNVTAPAVVLISHGVNKSGAFLVDGSRRPDAPGTGAGDQENRDGDNVFVIRPSSTVVGANQFDDLVVWRTQDQLYSETGQGSCVFP